MGIQIATSRAAIQLGFFLSISLLIFGVASVYLSYNFGDPAWEIIHTRLGVPGNGPLGVFIELLRLFFAVFGLLVVIYGFGNELLSLLHLDDRRTENERRKGWRIFFQLMFVVWAIGFGISETSKVLDQTDEGMPAKLIASFYSHDAVPESMLAQTKERSIQEQFDSSWWAHFLYAPYVLIFYSVISPLAIVLPLYALVVTDIPLLWRSSRTLRDYITDYHRADAVLRVFRKFRDLAYDRSMRYMNVLAVLAIFILFQHFIGHQSLSGDARQTAYFFAILILVLNAIFFAFLWYMYHDTWEKASRYLQQESEMSLSDEDPPLAFLGKLFRQNMSGYLVSLLLLVPLRDLLPFG